MSLSAWNTKEHMQTILYSYWYIKIFIVMILILYKFIESTIDIT